MYVYKSILTAVYNHAFDQEKTLTITEKTTFYYFFKFCNKLNSLHGDFQTPSRAQQAEKMISKIRSLKSKDIHAYTAQDELCPNIFNIEGLYIAASWKIEAFHHPPQFEFTNGSFRSYRDNHETCCRDGLAS